MSRREAFSAGPADQGERLDRVLARHLPDLSRSALQALVRAGKVRVGGRVALKTAAQLRAGDPVEVEVPPPEPSAFAAESVPLTVLYEDADLLVIDKPAGLVVHPAGGRRTGTLVNALLGREGALAPAADASRPGIVHRLDKDTSGCLVVARTPAARESLERQFHDRQVRKLYLAVVHGAPPARGEIDAAIGRDPRHRQRMAVRDRGGKAARSRFRTVERLPGAALVEVEIETGRTHQIRVHLASLGFPVVGDRVYGGRRRGGDLLAAFPRQALHAARLAFRHPRTGEGLEFRAPLPMDMWELLASLRAAAPAGSQPGRRA